MQWSDRCACCGDDAGFLIKKTVQTAGQLKSAPFHKGN
jgi:hypothetical protein